MVSEDPIGFCGSINPISYVNNAVANDTDPADSFPRENTNGMGTMHFPFLSRCFETLGSNASKLKTLPGQVGGPG